MDWRNKQRMPARASVRFCSDSRRPCETAQLAGVKAQEVPPDQVICPAWVFEAHGSACLLSRCVQGPASACEAKLWQSLDLSPRK